MTLKICLAGASWGCLFYIGAYKALLEKYDCVDICVYGNSTGALIATRI